jgi:Ca-activated chloride channel family protein
MEFFSQISFAHKWFLYLFCIIPLLCIWYFFKENNSKPSLLFSGYSSLHDIPKTTKERLRHLPFILRLFSLSFLIIALARPQSSKSWQNIKTEGIDIMLAQDISPSMLAQDLKPNRLKAAQDVAMDFIDGRPNDRIGLVIFSGESFTQCPLTSDHTVVKNVFSKTKTGMLAEGTAIGLGLANAISRIKDSKAKSKVIILLTDGVNNAGNVSPELAAEASKPFGIRIYTIGVGTLGMAYSPVAMYPNGEYIYEYVKCDIDEPVLKKIANTSGGKYFRATNKESLASIYQEIDKMEKTIVEERKYTKKSEWFYPFVWLASILLVVEFLTRNLYLKSSV